MSELGTSLALAGVDKQITQKEAEGIRTKALQAQPANAKAAIADELKASGMDEATALQTADKILASAESKAPVDVIKVDFEAKAAPNEAVDITSDVGKARLIQSAPQPDNNICGGAAVTNALILTSTDAESRHANAAAIVKTAKQLGKSPLHQDDLDAINALSAGKMTPKQAQRLQNLMYDLARATAGKGPVAKATGINSGMLGSLVTLLRQNGAFKNGGPVRFYNERNGPHWTCSVGSVHANSLPDANGKAGVAPVTANRIKGIGDLDSKVVLNPGAGVKVGQSYKGEWKEVDMGTTAAPQSPEQLAKAFGQEFVAYQYD